MKFQYSTRTLILATAFVACVCGAYSVWAVLLDRLGARAWDIAYALIFVAPFFMPAVFVSYAAGRRAFSVWLVLVFVVAESLSMGAAYWAMLQMKR